MRTLTACVLTCPTRARMFGDFDDPRSDVSRAVAGRGGAALMPELGYRPVNRYLPPRAPREVPSGVAGESLVDRVKQWVNRAVVR